MEEGPSKEFIDAIFAKYYSEEYIPQGQTEGDYPSYTPALINIGPKPITIEEYKRRTRKKTEAPKAETKKKSKRGGRRKQLKKKRQEIIRLLGLTVGEQKRKLYLELKSLNGKPKVEDRGSHKYQQQ